MAIIHRARLEPTKPELLARWLPSRPWASGSRTWTQLAAYRFDDPQGRVGLEALFLDDGGGDVLHVPLTYRDAPLDGQEADLVGTLEHSVLGTRWVYDGCADRVWLQALADVLAGVTHQADEVVVEPGGRVPRDPTARVRVRGGGSGPLPRVAGLSTADDEASSTCRWGGTELQVTRRVGTRAGARSIWGLDGRYDSAWVHLVDVTGPR